MSIEYKPLKELPKTRREVTSEYDEVIDRFLGDKETKYAEINKEGIKNVSLASALKTRIANRKLQNKVNVRMIGGKVYLAKA